MPNYRTKLPRIIWGTGAGVRSPTSFAGVANPSGGSFGAGTYAFLVSAIVGGVVSLPSVEIFVTVVAGGSITFSWAAVAGATGYRLWIGLAGAGSEASYRDVGNVLSYVETAGTAATAGTPAGFALNLGYLLDNVKAGDERRAGSSTTQAPSGIEDAWTVGIDYTLTADLRWIPQADTASPLATGWDGASGVRAWLASARDKQQFRFYPDSAGSTYLICYLVDPMTGQGDPETDGTRKLTIVIRTTDGPFDGY